ncbi:Alpha/beta hydrolase fold-3 domain protein [Reticulomyxa filosa]|uniref:Alpha/beta hydrolase fold-3 domain protein n=1 Tax=Reticulomyxa filosa TaxID=46433 RepID=X6PBS7_RETFI|nr:Alpha/beta hydrolase fold-3 domain protein [Reticulomyxa filosa]|eukprot:ETO35573.1 Alpha/beta hydrolase fold-3 domain protein [Reticulomyxa filosa]
MLLLLVTFFFGIIVLIFYFKLLGLSFEYLTLKWFLNLLVCMEKCKRVVRPKRKEISVQLHCINEWFKIYVKPDLVQCQTPEQLVKQTRQSRSNLLKYGHNLKHSTHLIQKQATIVTKNNQSKPGHQILWIYPLAVFKNLSDSSQDTVVLSFHGGAFLSGSMKSCVPYMYHLCNSMNAIVKYFFLLIFWNLTGVSFEYKLSPEHLLDEIVADTVQFYQDFIAHYQQFKNIVLVGDSAGATLIILLTLQLLKLNEGGGSIKLPICLIGMSCWDVPCVGNSYLVNDKNDAFLDSRFCRMSRDICLIGKKTTLNAVDFSYLKILEKDKTLCKNFPPLFLSYSEFECLADDTTRLYEILKPFKQIGKDLVCHQTPNNGFHVLELFSDFIPEGKKLIEMESAFALGCIKSD